MKSSDSAPKPPTNESSRSTDESNESSAPLSYDRPKLDPLVELEALLDSENFDGDRISVVQLELPPRRDSDRTSLMRDLRKKHPKLALFLLVIVAGAAWAKVIADAIETFR